MREQTEQEAAQNPPVPLNDRLASINYGGVVRVTWAGGLVTEHSMAEYQETTCNCGARLIPPEKFKYNGHCRSCFAEIVLNVRSVIFFAGGRYDWVYPVTQTETQKYQDTYPHYHADKYGNNFGIGDVVLYKPEPENGRKSKHKPKPREGTVLEVHKYQGKDSYHRAGVTFGARVDFGEHQQFIPSYELEALTNEHVTFEDVEKIPELRDIAFRGSLSQELKALFEDPVARAIWISYRRGHIMDQDANERLWTVSRNLAARLKETPMPRNRLALWLTNNFNMHLYSHRMEEQLAVFLVPYLTGEKVATYILMPDEAFKR